MSKHITTIFALVLLAAVTCGFTSTILQDREAPAAAAAPQESPKRKPPSAFTQRADYVLEPPDLVDVAVEDALPGRPIKGERPGAARRYDLAGLVR